MLEAIGLASRRSLGQLVARGRNALRRVRSGLPLRAENVSPEVPNDLFQAHLSIYWFFARFAAGKRVLDVGSGTGYGTAHLRRSGAAEVVGVDRDRKSVAYAATRYAGSGLRFLVADAEELPADLGYFELAVSSNVFEHLPAPARALESLVRHLSPDGTFVLVVPPIVDEASLAENRRIRFHVANLFVWEWAALLRRFFGGLRAFRHLPASGVAPDFADPFASRLTPSDFTFTEVPVEELHQGPTLAAVFVASRPLTGAPSA